MSALSMLYYTISGLMPLICVSCVGATLAYRKTLYDSTINSISAAYSNFFNPMFVFFNVLQAMDLSKFETIWPLFFTPSLMVVLGSVLALIHSKLFTPIPYLSRVVSCIIIFSNIGNLPIVLLQGMCSDYGPLHGDNNCSEANSYISVQVLTYNAIIWSYGYSLIFQDKEQYKISQNLLISPMSSKIQSLWRVVIKNLLSPGPLTCFIALLCSFIPGLRETFFTNSSVLYCFAKAGLDVGLAGVVLAQMSLGANLVFLRSTRIEITKSYLISIVVFKNIIMPLAALGMIYGFWSLGVFGSNKVMAYIVYISFCSPTAIVIMIISQNLNHGYKETSWIIVWIYALAIPTLICSTYAFSLVIRNHN